MAVRLALVALVVAVALFAVGVSIVDIQANRLVPGQAVLVEADRIRAIGTDYAVAGADLHRELEQLVAAGLTPAEVLHAPTLASADYFGLAA